MTQKELKTILDAHKKWLSCKPGGSKADLHGADLCGANLREADLHGADLREADLCGANLCGADLHGADLCGANLREADLYGADLREADLHGADLCGANLCGANLHGADLHGADLRESNFPSELLNTFFPISCPENGAFVGWKKCRDDKIVKLEICEDAKRGSAYGRKCRCSSAKVLAVENIDGSSAGEEAVSGRDAKFIYRVGEIVSVSNFDEDRRNECSTGIHFFITRQEAVDYVL